MATDPIHKMDSEKSVYLDREEHFHRGNLGAKTVVPYYYNSDTDMLEPATADSPAYAVRLDDASTADTTYIGKAAVASDTSDPVWQIAKLDTSSGLIKTWAAGSSAFSQVWDDRTSLSYS